MVVRDICRVVHIITIFGHEYAHVPKTGHIWNPYFPNRLLHVTAQIIPKSRFH